MRLDQLADEVHNEACFVDFTEAELDVAEDIVTKLEALLDAAEEKQ